MVDSDPRDRPPANARTVQHPQEGYMRVLTVYAHPNPASFCHAVLERFAQGLADAGHAHEVVDLYAIKFNPVYSRDDYAFFAHESVPAEIWNEAELRQQMVSSAGGPLR